MIKKDFRIIFAGGGTGGHLFSGIAVAEEIRSQFPAAQILFVGTPFGMEKEIIPKAGFPLEFIEASPLKGSGMMMRLKGLVRLPKAYFQSKKILKNFKPDIVIGIGGYASGPMTLAAHFSKIFTAIIEQNAYPGFTNRKLARFVDRVFISFEKARDFFDPEKTIYSGNPVRAFSPHEEAKNNDTFTLLVLGGSQGAHALNVAMMDALPLLKERAGEIHIIHQTGKNDFQEVKEAYEKHGISAEVYPFIDQMGAYYAKADLGICRAGAGTITELRLQGLPAILVPYPYAADDHQLFNAKEMVDQGAAELVLNKDLTGAVVAEGVESFIENPEKLKEMGQKAKKQAKPLAAQEVINHCLLALA